MHASISMHLIECCYLICTHVQLLYEFKKIIQECSIVETMETNWRGVGNKVLGNQVSNDRMTFCVERQLLDVVNKNVYHRKPSNLPIVFVEVIFCEN